MRVPAVDKAVGDIKRLRDVHDAEPMPGLRRLQRSTGPIEEEEEGGEVVAERMLHRQREQHHTATRGTMLGVVELIPLERVSLMMGSAVITHPRRLARSQRRRGPATVTSLDQDPLTLTQSLAATSNRRLRILAGARRGAVPRTTTKPAGVGIPHREPRPRVVMTSTGHQDLA